MRRVTLACSAMLILALRAAETLAAMPFKFDRGLFHLKRKAMIQQLVYAQSQMPAHLKCQILSFLRIVWPDGFVGRSGHPDLPTFPLECGRPPPLSISVTFISEATIRFR